MGEQILKRWIAAIPFLLLLLALGVALFGRWLYYKGEMDAEQYSPDRTRSTLMRSGMRVSYSEDIDTFSLSYRG